MYFTWFAFTSLKRCLWSALSVTDNWKCTPLHGRRQCVTPSTDTSLFANIPGIPQLSLWCYGISATKSSVGTASAPTLQLYHYLHANIPYSTTVAVMQIPANVSYSTAVAVMQIPTTVPYSTTVAVMQIPANVSYSTAVAVMQILAKYHTLRQWL